MFGGREVARLGPPSSAKARSAKSGKFAPFEAGLRASPPVGIGLLIFEPQGRASL